MDCMDASHWRCHNCSCGTKASEKLAWCRMSVLKVHLDDCPLWIQFCEWLWHQHAVAELFLHNVLWLDKRVLCVLVCPTVASGPRTHIICECLYKFSFVRCGLVLSGGIVLGPSLLPDMLTAQRCHNPLDTVLLVQAEAVPLAVRLSLGLQHDGALAYNAEDVWQQVNAAYP
jgi:hypothetical protein